MQNQGMLFIKEWRELRGLTLQALGEALEPPASAGTIHTYESGKRKPSLDRLIEMGRVLNIPAGLLVDGPPGTDRSKAAGADTPPPALELDVEILARAIADVQPAYVAARDDPDASLNAANAIASVLRSAARSPTIRDDPASWAAVVDVAIDAFFGPKAPRRPSLPSTQRHKSDKP